MKERAHSQSERVCQGSYERAFLIGEILQRSDNNLQNEVILEVFNCQK
jgi:hypothetical protein